MTEIAYTVMDNFRRDLYSRLEAMTPNRESQTAFRPRTVGAVALTEIGDTPGQARVCELKKVIFKKFEWTGKDPIAVRFTIPLEIIYPDTYDWRAIAVDDVLAIADDLVETPLATTGVALCVMDQEDGPKFEDIADGDWFRATVPLLTIIEESS